jgi:hypothetical protein
MQKFSAWSKSTNVSLFQIIVPAVSDEDAKKRFPKGFTAKKPYLRVTPQPQL